MSNFDAMKRLKFIASILTIIALLLSGWSMFELYNGKGDLAQALLNLIYFFTLFIVLLCVRISMGINNRITWAVYIISAAVFISSTTSWIMSAELLVTGMYTIGLLPVLIGSTMISTVNPNVKWSKYTQVLIGIIALSLSICVFTEVFGSSIYEMLLFGMIFLTVAVFGLSFFSKPT